jgi:abelson tyrosine-protein kinase 1
MNRLGCLRLTERCADILISVRIEISDAGDVLGQELAAPIGKLEEYVLCRIFIAVASYIL